MASFLQILIIPLVSCSVALVLAVAQAQSGDSTYFHYVFSSAEPPGITFQGDAHLPGIYHGYLGLTKTEKYDQPLNSSTGRIVYTKPVKFWEAGAQADFETLVTFNIIPKTGDDSPGDGIAFFMAPVGTTPGADGASLGVFDRSGKKSNVFAVECDLYPNHGVDPRYPHIGIDIESLQSRNVTEVGGALLGWRIDATINYKASTNLIRVKLRAFDYDIFEVSYVYDLSKILDQQVQIGVSASSGVAVAAHEVVAWYFNSTLVRTGSEEAAEIRQFV